MSLTQKFPNVRRITTLQNSTQFPLRFLLIVPLLIGPGPLCVRAAGFAESNFGTTKPPAAPAQAPGTVEEGYSLLAGRNYPRAEAAFRSALAAQPHSASAARGLALTLWNEGKKSESVQEFTVAAQLSPDDFEAHYDLAKAAWGAAEPPAQHGAEKTQSASLIPAAGYRLLALSEMRRAQELRPKDADVQLSLAQLYLDTGKPKDAAVQAAQAARLDPSNPGVFVTLGQAYFAQGDDVRATSEYQKAIQINAHDPAPYMALGQLRTRSGDLPGAEAAFRSAIQVAPTSGPAYAALGQILLQTHRDTQAQSLLARAVTLNPNEWESEYLLGKALAEAGQFDQAGTLFQKALELNPGFPAAREQLALQMLRRGNLAGAVAQAQALFVQNPQSSEGHQVMALVLWKQRDYDGSLAECAQVLNSDSNSPRTLAVQALDLWQQRRRADARRALVTAGKLQPKILSSQVFCRLVLCDAKDISIVGDFLQKNRWILNPPPDY